MKRSAGVTLICTVLVFSLSSCAAWRNLTARIGMGAADRSLADGNYDAALKQYQEAVERYPDNGEVGSAYRAALEQVRRTAEAAYRKRDYLLAGRMFRALRDRFPADDRMGRSFSFSKQQIDLRLVECRDRSLRQGILQYRRGRLKHAITVWEGILTFDPENAGVKKAVRTATVQLENLERF